MISQTTLFWQQQKIDLTAIVLTKDTPYFALAGELWGVFCNDFGENFPRYNGIDIVKTVRPRQGGRHFDRRHFKCIFLNENAWISINISPKFVPKFPIVDIQALVQMMAWRQPGDKPLSEALIV